MSMGKIKYVVGDDTDDAPLYQQLLKTSKENATAAKKAAFDQLTALKVEEKVARAGVVYYVVE